MTRRRNTIEQRLTQAHVAITNVLGNPELQTALAAYGYTAERMQQGELLRDAAKAHYQQKVTAYGGLRSALDARTSAEQQAQATYLRHVKIARLALEDNRGALEVLHLSGRRKFSLAGWLAQAQQFYTMALTDSTIQQRLAEFSLTARQLEQGGRAIAAVAACHAAQRQQQGMAQDATRERNEALTALDQWMRDFRTIARIALKNRPQLLEQLGMAVRA